MGQAISVNVKLEKEDAGEFSAIILKNKMRLSKRQLFLLAITITIMVLLLIYSLFTAGDSSNLASGAGNAKGRLSIWPIALFFLLVLYRIISPYITKIIAQKQFEKDRFVQKETEYTFSSEGIKAESDLKIVNLHWVEVLKIVETKQYFALYEMTQTANIIPKRCFANEEEMLAAAQIMKDSIRENKYEMLQGL